MSNAIVKIIAYEDGDLIENPKWCWVYSEAGFKAFCSGLFFGGGESGVKFETKDGKITCPDCIRKIKEIKAVKL